MESEAQASMRTGPARILIADDHDLVRDGFQRILDNEPDLKVVGEAANGREAVGLCRSLRPDLVLMDVRMPELDGLEATRVIKSELPAVSVLMVTTYENPDYLLEAIEAGAAGYVLKATPKRELVDTVRRILSGEPALTHKLAYQLLRRFAGATGEGRYGQSPQPERPSTRTVSLGALTPRELEVLRLVAQGRTNAQVAEALRISAGTAKIHVQNIISKLGVSDRTQAVVRAIELGLVAPETAQ